MNVRLSSPLIWSISCFETTRVFGLAFQVTSPDAIGSLAYKPLPSIFDDFTTIFELNILLKTTEVLVNCSQTTVSMCYYTTLLYFGSFWVNRNDRNIAPPRTDW
jgi:hypothetical protein